LTGVGFMDSDNVSLMNVGDYAFAKSGLKKCRINLRRSVSDTGSGKYCFASCYNLTQF